MVSPIGEPIRRMAVISSIDLAIKHTKRVLFAPFDFARWFSFGVIIFLAMLAGGGGVGLGFNMNFRGLAEINFEEFNPRVYILELEAWVSRNGATVIAAVALVGMLGGAFIVFLRWLGSHGQVMLIRAVALNEEEVGRNWQTTRDTAWSLFLFRVVLIFCSWVLFGLFSAIVYLSVRGLAVDGVKGFWPYFNVVWPNVLVYALLGFAIAIMMVFLRDFVVPLMYLRNVSCLAAWAMFARIAPRNILPILGFLAIKFVYAVGFTFVAAIAGYCTCCIGFLPVIHQTLLAPFYVFDRAFSLFMLQSLGPDFRFIPPDEAPGGLPPALAMQESPKQER